MKITIDDGMNKAMGGGNKQNLAAQGQRGDTQLAHVNPWEQQLLKMLGGVGTRNPKTGLKQFYTFENPDFLGGGLEQAQADYDAYFNTATPGSVTPWLGGYLTMGDNGAASWTAPEGQESYGLQLTKDMKVPEVTGNAYIRKMVSQIYGIDERDIGTSTWNDWYGTDAQKAKTYTPTGGYTSENFLNLPTTLDEYLNPTYQTGLTAAKSNPTYYEQTGTTAATPDTTGTTTGTTDATGTTASTGTGVDLPLDIMPTSSSASSSYTGLPSNYSQSIMDALMPQLTSGINNMSGNIDEYTKQALGSYQQQMMNAIKQNIGPALNQMAKRGIISSTEGQKILANVYSQAATDASTKGYETAMQSALKKADIPTTLSSIAEALGKSSASNSYSYSEDPTVMYQTLADLIKAMM
jgi:hypothetical protein